MKYALANSLSTAVSGLDPDAKAYIDAVVAAGATVTSTQKNAINTFVKDGKSDGWWASMKRIYFPIWGIAAPNAIDMVSLASGTFVGNVTHSAGSVDTTSPTGHFIGSGTPASLGLSSSSASIFSAIYSGLQDFMGVGGASNSRLLVGRVGGITTTAIPSTLTTAIGGSDSLGILIGSRVGNITSLYQRKASGWITPINTTMVDATALPLFTPSFLGNFNNSGSVTTGRTTTGKFISYGLATGLTSPSAQSFSLALKVLWESSTGLSLP